MKLNSRASHHIPSKIATSIASLQKGAQNLVKVVKKNTKAILAMSMIAGGSQALSTDHNTDYHGSITTSSSEWSITDHDGGELDMWNIEEIVGAKIRYHAEIKNQQVSSHEAYIKMRHAPKYQVERNNQQQENIEEGLQQFKQGVSKQLRHDLSRQLKTDNLNFDGFARVLSFFKTPSSQQSIENLAMKIHGEASFVGNGAKNQQLAQDRAAYIADLLNKENITTETSVGSLSETQQSQLSTFAQNLKMPVKRLIQEHNRGKKFGNDIDGFLTEHLDEKQGVHIESKTQITHILSHESSLSAYWLVIAGLGITFRKRLKNASQGLTNALGRLQLWGQKIFNKKGSADDARERLRENLQEIRSEVDDPRVNLDDLDASRTQEITYHREPKKTWRQRCSDLFHRKQGSQKDLKDDTPLSSDIITERLKNLLATEGNDQRDTSLSIQGQERASKGETEKTIPQSQPLEPQQEPKIQPIKQDRWRPNARRAISAFDTLIEESILRSEDIPKGLIERKDLLRDLMKKESWDILEREIRSIIRILRTQHIQYTKQDKDDLLSHLDQFADDIAQRERFGRGYLSHTMSPYFVQKEIKNMKCTPIAYRIQDLTHFVPTTKFDLGYGEYVYLSNRVRAADGAKNDHIAIYTLHEGKLTGYIFEESRTTGEWKLLPSKQWEHSTLLDSITTQHNTHKTKSLGSLTIHSLNPEIISEIFKQPITSTMARSKIMQIFHTASPGSHHIDQAA